MRKNLRQEYLEKLAAMREAITNCRAGNFFPESGNGLRSILEYVGYDKNSAAKFDPDMLHAFGSDHHVGKKTIIKWIEESRFDETEQQTAK